VIYLIKFGQVQACNSREDCDSATFTRIWCKNTLDMPVLNADSRRLATAHGMDERRHGEEAHAFL
jgi:hypothetical protein